MHAHTHTHTLTSMGCANIDVQKLIWYNAKTSHQRLPFAPVTALLDEIYVYFARTNTHHFSAHFCYGRESIVVHRFKHLNIYLF